MRLLLAIAIPALLTLTGCNTTHYHSVRTYQEPGTNGVVVTVTNVVDISNSRLIWSSEGIAAKLDKSGGTLSVIKSNPDADFVKSLTELLTTLGISAAPK
jgi:hypothetical protein